MIAAFIALQLLNILIFQNLTRLQIVILDWKVLLAQLNQFLRHLHQIKAAVGVAAPVPAF